MKIVKKLILRTIAGEAVLVPVGEFANEFNGLLSLSDTAKTIWENLEKTESVDDMVRILINEYEVEEELARKDIIGFTDALIDHGFLSYSDPEKKW